MFERHGLVFSCALRPRMSAFPGFTTKAKNLYTKMNRSCVVPGVYSCPRGRGVEEKTEKCYNFQRTPGKSKLQGAILVILAQFRSEGNYNVIVFNGLKCALMTIPVM
jgi:hypothetical protein